MQQIGESFERYLSMPDANDHTEHADASAKTARLQDRITTLKEQMQRLKEVEARLQDAASPSKTSYMSSIKTSTAASPGSG
jgi:hypothetical protein